MNEKRERPERPDRAPDTLDRWAAAATAELGIDPPGDFIKTVLNLARVAAHRVDRPAAAGVGAAAAGSRPGLAPGGGRITGASARPDGGPSPRGGREVTVHAAQ